MKKRYFILTITVLILTIVLISFVGCKADNSSSASLSSFMVCLDPGHPSENNDGAELYHGLKEVEINWQVTQRLMKLLQVQGIPVILTKKAQTEYVDNKTRAQIANRAKSTLFVRLHCDSGGGRGITFYYPDKPGTKDGKTGPSTDIIAKSREAALVIQSKTVAKLGESLQDNGIKGESETLIGGQQGALTGSIYSEVPVITVEMVFLDFLSDARFIGSENGQQKMAEALKDGITSYLSSKSQ